MLGERPNFDIDQCDVPPGATSTAGIPPHTTCCAADSLAELTRAVTDADGIRNARRQLVLRSATVLGTPEIALTRRFDGERFGFVMFAGDAARRAAGIEHETGDGPAWEVQATATSVHSVDLADEPRWQAFPRLVTDATPIRTVLALPLTCGRDLLGALVAYADRAGFFAGARLHRAQLLAAHAAAALAGVTAQTKARNLEVALRTNREIATAVGIVMNRLRLTDDQAFSYLSQLSQQRHLKLSALADRIVVSGEVPMLTARTRVTSRVD